MSASVNYRAYLLRLWRTADDEWRASLDDPHTGERLAFASLADCCEYLLRAARSGLAAGEAAHLAAKEASEPP